MRQAAHRSIFAEDPAGNIHHSDSFHYLYLKTDTMSCVSALYHIVINTYNRSFNIQLEHADDLYAYISGIVRTYNSKMLAINGTSNHIHMLVDLHPSACLSELMRDIKQSSNIWMKQSGKFPKFSRWGREYFAFTCSQREAQHVKQYITNQREHHGCLDFDDEIRRIVERNCRNWNDNLLS